MTALSIRTTAGGETAIPKRALEALAGRVRGPLLRPGDAGYDGARAVWNAMIDRRPALIVRCTGAADVIDAVNFAREHDLLLSVRGGGHNIAGTAVCDGGLMIDLAPMRGVRVDPVGRTARAQPGVTLGDLDRETQAFGLVVPAGIVSTTGVAGLTLGGGFGWLTRRHAYTCDNLTAADVVTADGNLLAASTEENPDLFWAIRGGGGNFGVVTSFEYRLHPLGPEVVAGMVVHPVDRAPDVVALYRGLSAAATEDLCCALILRLAPPAPFLPPEIHGRPIAAIALCHAGAVEAGLRAVQPVKGFGAPIADTIGPKPFRAHQTMLDATQPKGRHYYWKSHYLDEFGAEAGDTLVAHASRITSSQSAILVMQLGGAMGRIGAGETAVGHRDARHLVTIMGSWLEPPGEAHVAWARACWEALAPFSLGAGYVNFLTEDELSEDVARVRAAYGETNHARLAALKARYDPTNLFRLNQNIRPAG